MSVESGHRGGSIMPRQGQFLPQSDCMANPPPRPECSAPRNDSLWHREAVLRDVAGACVPHAILALVLGAVADRLAQRTQAERLADDEAVQREREHQGLALGLLQHLL